MADRKYPEEVIQEILITAETHGIHITALEVSKSVFDYLASLCKVVDHRLIGENPRPRPKQLTYYSCAGDVKIMSSED